MSRSFPGAFCKSRGKSSYVAAKSKATKEVTVPFYLLPKMRTKTPNPKDEFSLIKAGLGKRSLVVLDDTSHAELSEMLCLEFPKMQALEGGWLLYKAMGGCGQRPLTVVTPEAEGYTGALVQTASNSGKSILFIVPLQKAMDLTPLALSSKEFQKMPKAICSKCNEQMPLPFLSGHIAVCCGTPHEDNESNQELDNLGDASCPICQNEFPPDVIEVHASVCGERHAPTIQPSAPTGSSQSQTVRLSDSDNGDPPSLDNILQQLAQRVVVSERFTVFVTRVNFFQRALQQWKRQKRSSPQCSLSVEFVGEPGVDTGAIRKEFLTDVISGIELRYFEPATDGQGKNPMYSITDLEDDHFRIFGEIMAVSVAQGGPAPTFMRNWCYNYLATGNFDCKKVLPEDVTDPEANNLIEKVRAATNEELLDHADGILSYGYTGVINGDKKDAMIRAISLHPLARLLPLLDQMRKGLQLYNFSHMMEQHVNVCRPLFVPLKDNTPDANFIMACLRPVFSGEGTTKRTLEQDILNHFQDYLQQLEDDDEAAGPPGPSEEGTEELEKNNKPLTVPVLLQWITGQAHKPILPSEKNQFWIHVKYNHCCEKDHEICFPVVSACAKTITFPVAHMTTLSEFKRVLSLAVRFGNAFGRI